MTIAEKQKELDLAKWNKSQSLRLDACGTFDYCCNCDKGLKNPCAHAYSKFFNEQLESDPEEVNVEVIKEDAAVEKKKPATKKATSTKTTATKKCTKKETTKTTTKKTTSKTTKK